MKSQCFSLRLVTPAFVAGAASGRAQTDLPTKGEKPWEYTIRPEGDSIRVASLRGILRFWFRAAALEWDETRLFERESRVFGSTEHGQGLRLQAIGGDPWQGETITAKPGSAKAYLGYGPIGATRKGEDFSSKNRFVFRQAVPAATTLHFRAFGRPDQIEELKRCLLLLHLFGGIGSRSRRTWGSVEVVGADIPPIDARSADSLANLYGDLLHHVWQGEPGPSARTGVPKHSAFHTKTRVRVTPVRASWEDVMVDFHKRFEATRLWNFRGGARESSPIGAADHDLEVRTADVTRSRAKLQAVPKRVAYGLPYAPESNRNNWRVEYVRTPRGTTPDPQHTEGRRASPLFLKVVRLADGRYAGVALFLGGRFFAEDDAEIGAVIGKGHKQAKPGSVPFPGYEAVHEFLDARDWASVPLP